MVYSVYCVENDGYIGTCYTGNRKKCVYCNRKIFYDWHGEKESPAVSSNHTGRNIFGFRNRTIYSKINEMLYLLNGWN